MELLMERPDFAGIYSGQKEMVWRLISRYVTRHSDKEDLFQEIMLSIHKALPRFRGDSSLETWIYRIALNASINFLKKQERNKKLLSLLKVFGRPEISEDPVITESEKILLPLEKLNPKQKMILLLSDVEEKKLDDIADIMKMPVGTVKSNLFRAREIIKKEVKKNG
jgi:RNA polymerase sigma-70 factor, ECF subfamily